jgi:thiol-disulfide isomerase/thioredoxin
MENITDRIKYISSIEEFNKIINNNKIVIVKASATWCKPCKVINPFFNICIKELPPDVCIVFIDIDEASDIKRKYKIKAVPYFANFIDGDITDITNTSDKTEIKSFLLKTLKNINK